MKHDTDTLPPYGPGVLSPAEEHFHQLVEMAEKTGLLPDDVMQMLEAKSNGESWREYFDLNPEAVQSYQDVASSLYNARRYEEAEGIFRFLISMGNDTPVAAWRGLGACRQMALDFDEAITCYRCALVLNVDDQLSYMWLADCLSITGRRQDAVNVLEVMLKWASEGSDKVEAHTKRARAMLQAAQQRVQVGQ